MPKKKIAVWKFASCDGCQLSLLDCEDELLTVAGAVELSYFLEATRAVVEGPYDVSIVEGSITTPHDADRIREVRAMSKALITIGACATSGGVQALRNFADVEEFTRIVYASPDYITHARDIDADQRQRPGRLRTAGVPDQQGAAARGAERVSERAPAPDPLAQRLHRVQAARNRVRDGCARDRVPGSGHQRRLRCDLPELRPGVLRLLRSKGDAEPGVAELVERDGGSRPRAGVPNIQRRQGAIPGSK